MKNQGNVQPRNRNKIEAELFRHKFTTIYSTFPGNLGLNNSRSGRVWLVTSRLGTGISQINFLQCELTQEAL